MTLVEASNRISAANNYLHDLWGAASWCTEATDLLHLEYHCHAAMTDYLSRLKQWSVYILYCKEYKKTYTGITVNVIRRLAQHNRGTGAKATRGLQWVLIHQEQAADKRAAQRQERKLKKLSKAQKFKLAGYVE